MSQNKRFDQNIKDEKPNTAKGKAGDKDGRPKRKERKPPKKITSTYLHNSGLYYLERFAASSAHFKTVMMRKVRKSCAHHENQDFDECAALVDQLVERFIENGLLNDHLYIRGNVQSMQRRGISTRSIIAKLQGKGVHPDQTRQALEEFHEEHGTDPAKTELIGALKYARKKRLANFYDDEIDPDLKNKQMARLARQGFSYDICQKVFATEVDEAEDMLHDHRF